MTDQEIKALLEIARAADQYVDTMRQPTRTEFMANVTWISLEESLERLSEARTEKESETWAH